MLTAIAGARPASPGLAAAPLSGPAAPVSRGPTRPAAAPARDPAIVTRIPRDTTFILEPHPPQAAPASGERRGDEISPTSSGPERLDAAGRSVRAARPGLATPAGAPGSAPLEANASFEDVELASGGKSMAVVLAFHPDALQIRSGERVAGEWRYARIAGATYSTSRHGRLGGLAGTETRHWLTLDTPRDHRRLRLDKANYKAILAALRAHGVKVAP